MLNKIQALETMRRDFYIYEWYRLDNNTCFYVGKGTRNRDISPKNHNKAFMGIYNNENIEIACVRTHENLTEQEAYELEEETIENYVFNEGYGICIKGYQDKSVGFLTNMQWGGKGGMTGVKQSEETKRKRGEALKGHKVLQKTRDKISKNQKGKEISIETRDRISKALTGRKLSDEHVKKIKEKNSGANNPMYGVSMSESSRKKMSESRKGKARGSYKGGFDLYMPDGSYFYAKTMADVTEKTGLTSTMIYRLCREEVEFTTRLHRFKHMEGLKCKYKKI